MTYKHNGGTVDELNELLRALARCEHSDTSIAEEAADALEAARAEVERLREEVDALREEVDALREALKELITWTPSAATYRRLGFDPGAPMRALAKARTVLAKGGKEAGND